MQLSSSPYTSLSPSRLPLELQNLEDMWHKAQLRFSQKLSMSSIFIIIICFSALLLLFPAYSALNDLSSTTKTIVGHNLEPTPWHVFSPRTDKPSTFSIIQCSYLNSCPKLVSPFLTKPSHIFFKNPVRADCPSFFSSIHRDLAPWSQTGISLPLIENAARQHGAFRVVIKDSKVYVDLFYACVESRMLFTIWGFVQLVRRYPGLVPNVDMVFDCMDRPVVKMTTYSGHGAPIPPPLFRYCTTKEHLDIPFPDWSFWGWPEVNIQPWDVEFKSIENGSNEIEWKDKVQYAYWKGNPDVASPVRVALLNCNDTEKWQARIFRQDWIKESAVGYKSSKLSSQCNYRYKIYAEGYAWSVSLKYILACGSETLIIDSQYEDFFSRGLIPKENFWPIRAADLCQSIKEAVEWGNVKPQEAKAIGTRGQDLMRDISMDRVYDYMLHLLVEYSALLDFKPKPPPTAQEVCIDSLLCFADKQQREFLERSVASPSENYPCTLPPR